MGRGKVQSLSGGELECDLLAGKALVDLGVHVDLLDGLLLNVLVEVHLEELGAVKLDPRALTNHFGREDKVVQDGLVHRHKGAAAGALLRVLATGAALLAHDATLQ